MSNTKKSSGKFSLMTIISLGTLVLGIGCICWALINILIQPRYLDYVNPSYYSNPAAFGVNELGLMVNDFVPTEHDEILYPSYPSEGEVIGSLSIPVLKKVLPIIQGTGDEELKKGVGHFTKSVLPGEKDNCVLSGHRDTVFTKLDELKIGDKLIVQTSAGTFTYEVNNTRIVDKDDKTVIIPTDNAVLTLTTCYPFNVFDLYPQERYIITANLVISE